jgi:hypothetical protein
MAMRTKSRKRKNEKAIERLGELLQDVLESLDDEPEEGEEADLDPADVQGALAEAISTLINEGLLDQSAAEKPPSLAAIFDKLEIESELVERAGYFEDLISGYEDRAHVDDLREAYDILKSILEKITVENA